MKSNINNLSLTFFVVITFLLPQVVFGGWLYERGYEDIDTDLEELDRIDNGAHSPFHELDAGVYGYWRTTSEFDIVLDFGTANVVVSPYTWSDVIWVPGPMDYIPPIGSINMDWLSDFDNELCECLTHLYLNTVYCPSLSNYTPPFLREEC